jgi:toluene monooxygenase system ferredoxin subunit
LRRWCQALPANELWEGELAAVPAGGGPVLLVRLSGGELRAYQASCPHQGNALADGEFDGRFLTCAAHCWKFDLATGRGVNPAAATLARFPVCVRDDHIFVELEEKLK